jgi:hypothetical protein
MNLATRSKKDDATAQFAKLQRAEDGKKAMSEYEADAIAVRSKTARLRALRLARDAEQAAAVPPPAAAKKAPKSVKGSKTGAKTGAKTGKSTKTKSDAKLANWLDDQEKSGRNS